MSILQNHIRIRLALLNNPLPYDPRIIYPFPAHQPFQIRYEILSPNIVCYRSGIAIAVQIHQMQSILSQLVMTQQIVRIF